MVDPAIQFSIDYDLSFRALTNKLSHKEIPLFEAMQSALTSLNSNFEVENHHGSAHQVEFNGNGTYARTNARCELSDLMIVCFSTITGSVRLTFLQAKSERAVLPTPCTRQFSANLEQWFLLKNRPSIHGVGTFNPPKDLLSNALLSSIGSFAFFYKDAGNQFQTYYSAASYMKPPRAYHQRYGKLRAIGPCLSHGVGVHTECLSACGNRPFAENLFRLQIGAPIDNSVYQAKSTRSWLSSILKNKIIEAQKLDTSFSVAQELEALISPNTDEDFNGFIGARQIILIKSTTPTK